MCTATTYKTKDFYFGRNLDYDISYGETIVITPRKYKFRFRNNTAITEHYAIIGMACVIDNYPLYFDAMNEKGLAVAGLNFVGNAAYFDAKDGCDNVAQFEFIPWLLCRCGSVKEARELLQGVNITNTPFNDSLPVAQLHWLIADREDCIVVEQMNDGIHIYDNPVGVLTNNPSFDKQLFALNNYRNLSPQNPENTFCDRIVLDAYSRGMGGIGLPGDLSSQSRFVKAAFTKLNSVSGDSEEESVSQCFHILHSVEQQRGCCELDEGRYEITIYTSCCNVDKGVYYYTAYNNHRITAVDMHREELSGAELICYPMVSTGEVLFQN